MKKQWLRRSVSFVCGVLLSLAAFPPTAKGEGNAPAGVAEPPGGAQAASPSYENYLKDYPGVRTVDTVYEADPAVTGSAAPETYDGHTGYVLEPGGRMDFTFTVEKNGFYPLSFFYYALPGKGMDIGVKLLVDGRLPFAEAAHIRLKRQWKDQKDSPDGGFDVDLSGDQRVPSQEEAAGWQKAQPRLTGVLRDEPVKLYLRSGTHTLTFCGVQESCALRDAALGGGKAVPTYEEYRAARKDAGSASAAPVFIEAENAARKSDNGLSPYADRSTPAVTPADTRHVLLNAIGGYNWREAGQWISWEFTVPADGYYTLTFHDRQADKQGMSSYRAVYIDEEIPFAELSAVAFSYTRQWRYDTLSDREGRPYGIWLKAGSHTLRMEACLGETAPALAGLEESVARLNAVYREIVVLTGASPDANRDYYLEQEIPGLMEDMERVHQSLCAQQGQFRALGGDGGGNLSYIQVVVDQLALFLKDPGRIPAGFTAFRSSITVLADILLSMKEQPLALDAIRLTPEEQPVETPKSGWWDTLRFRFSIFLRSFTADYATLPGGREGKTIRIWVSQNDIAAAGVAVGRDQAQLLQKMIQSDFYAKTGVQARLSLVNSGASLIQAIVSGRNPDVVMFTAETTPVTLALRGAAEDLTAYEGFDRIRKRFYPSAFRSFAYGGGIYAVPDIQTFYVTFCRTDIFGELVLTVPDTWTEFYSLVKKLQRHNLSAGIPGGDQNMLETLLFQKGSDLYREDLSVTCLTDTAAIEAFDMWTRLYSHFGLDVAFDFLSRFRSGEMPIGIMPLTTYNTLVASAPEIDGLWGIAPIPGEKDAQGNIVRTESCAVTGTMLLKKAQNKEECFAFLDWWTQGEVQARFGVETEATFGVANRYFAANREAFYQLPWTPEETAVLELQWAQVTDVAQTPASYYVSRCISNAFRNVVYYHKNPREILTKYAAQMDEELARKRREFGLT